MSKDVAIPQVNLQNVVNTSTEHYYVAYFIYSNEESNDKFLILGKPSYLTSTVDVKGWFITSSEINKNLATSYKKENIINLTIPLSNIMFIKKLG